jgi:NADH-quinone oxidoreductase subunit J
MHALFPMSFAGLAAPAQTGWCAGGIVAAAAPGSALISPVGLFILAVVGAIGMLFLLPSRKPASLRAVGGVILLAVGIVIPVIVGVRASRALGASTGIDVYFWIFSSIAVLAAVRVITHRKPVYSALYFVLTVMASAGLFVLMWAQFMAAALVLVYAGAILVTYVFVIMLAAEAHPQSGTGITMQQRIIEYDAVSREPIVASAVGFALLGMVMFVVFDQAPTDLGAGASGGESTAVQFAKAQAEDISPQVFTMPTTRPTTGPYAAGAEPRAPIDRKTFPSSKNLIYSYTDAHSAVNANKAGFKSNGGAPQFVVASDATTTQAVLGFQPVGSTQRLGMYLFDTQRINLELAGLLLTVAMVGAIVIAHRKVVSVQPAVTKPLPSDLVIGPATPIDDNPHSIPVYGTENPRQKEYPET